MPTFKGVLKLFDIKKMRFSQKKNLDNTRTMMRFEIYRSYQDIVPMLFLNSKIEASIKFLIKLVLLQIKKVNVLRQANDM